MFEKHISIHKKQWTGLFYWFVLLSPLIFACHYTVERNAPKNFCDIPAASGGFRLPVQIGKAFQILLDQVDAPDSSLLFS